MESKTLMKWGKTQVVEERIYEIILNPSEKVKQVMDVMNHRTDFLGFKVRGDECSLVLGG